MAQANNMPVYAVAANRQLEAIARGRPGSRGAWRGFRASASTGSRYGDAILGLSTAFLVG
jgi:hypothetical protein